MSDVPAEGITTAKGHWTAEGPVWDAERKVFFYTDIEGGTLHQYNPTANQTTSWQIGRKGTGDKNGQMIGGTTAINQDGSLIVMLEAGPNAGVNYFNPVTGRLVNIPDSLPETDKPHNRPNDSTVIKTNDGNRLVWGTMSKQWEAGLPQGRKDGAFYMLGENLKPQKLTIDPPYPGTVISNGLADGGLNRDGTVNLFWAETVGANSELKVWRGKLDPKTNHVGDVKIFADHQALTDGRDGRPDGSNMILVEGKPAYAVAALQTGEIRAFDPETGKRVAGIPLPEGLTNVTKFAIGEDGNGKPALFATSINFTYPEGKDGPNGGAVLLPLPKNISLHPASARVTHYPPMREVVNNQVPGTSVDLSQAKIIPPTFKREK